MSCVANLNAVGNFNMTDVRTEVGGVTPATSQGHVQACTQHKDMGEGHSIGPLQNYNSLSPGLCTFAQEDHISLKSAHTAFN